ncbi:MAG: PEP-CTERM sorting domain-containing protein [Proteobacteria bacterium]|nr:PEP-CTERM sorting domain-containing protein [Pseudomonadota bacterium]MBU1585418.1 PEP-CTERM sorting domain-containing protein [Pseudomonadota bacterium]MBU2455460.1 PEP-CTERM sorting domain-containing protein [Pseudomonadota bacterium]MBU2627469.1 PEP-CTERM sorting domain-containing protein [Pseudomonadota bacterium]
MFLMLTSPVLASSIYWTDWLTSNSANGFTGQGTITTSTSTLNVTYNNPNGIGFFQASGGIDYWQNSGGGRNDAISPYTSNKVDNSPTGTDIIALRYAGTQTLTFSEAIANPVFSYVSLNGNGYGFDQDFDILSYGGLDGNAQGYWGSGTSYKNVVDLGGGNFEYQLLGTGEPHGTIRFKGAFSTVTWQSLSNEYWNGFTVGVEGTEKEIFNNTIPEPTTILLFGLGLLGFAGVSRRKK